jgi:cell division protein FtsI/penicillin-binding protein 2
VAGRWIRDHAEPGLYDLDEVIIHSANTGVIELAHRLPPELIRGSFAAFGFGSRSGVAYPAEARGLLPELAGWSKMSRAGFALGQELTASPLQLAMAYAAIANGGELLRPLLVERASHGGESLAEQRDDRRRIMDRALAARLGQMLERVVEEGTGKEAQVPGYRVAGKTGTAQSAVAGGFDDSHHVAWFAGFLPLPEPRFAVVVAVNQPARDFWASSVAAPVFAEIAGAAVGMSLLPPSESVGGEVVRGEEL